MIDELTKAVLTPQRFETDLAMLAYDDDTDTDNDGINREYYIHPDYMQMMLDYFESEEEYEKCAVIRDKQYDDNLIKKYNTLRKEQEEDISQLKVDFESVHYDPTSYQMQVITSEGDYWLNYIKAEFELDIVEVCRQTGIGILDMLILFVHNRMDRWIKVESNEPDEGEME